MKAFLAMFMFCLLFETLPIAFFQDGTIMCAYAEEEGVLRARASQLRSAVARCRQRIARGEIDECTVRVQWENRSVSMEEAESLAARLEQLARAQCVRQAGERLAQEREKCQLNGRTCLRDSGIDVSVAACLAGCSASRSLPGCLSTCGVAGMLITGRMQSCVDQLTACFERSLSDDRAQVQRCKQ